MEGSQVGAGGDELREGDRERSWGLHRAAKGMGSHVGGLTALLSCNSHTVRSTHLKCVIQ